MTALKAWAALAAVVGDAGTEALANAAYANATAATVSILYNTSTEVHSRVGLAAACACL